MTRRKTASMSLGACLALFALACVLAPLAVDAGKRPIPSVLNTFWCGGELFKASLQGVGKTRDLGTSCLDIDSEGNFTYEDGGGQFTGGRIAQDGKKLLATLDTVEDLESQFAQLIVSELTLEGIDPGVVTVDIDPAQVKIKAKLKTGRSGSLIKVKLKVRGTALSSEFGSRKAKSQTKAILQEF